MPHWKLEPTKITMPLLASAILFGGLVWIGLYGIQYVNGFKTPQPLWYGLIHCLLTIPFYFYVLQDNRKHNRPAQRIASWKYAAAMIITLALVWPTLKTATNLPYDDPYLDGRNWYLKLGGAGVLYVLVLGVLSVRRKVGVEKVEDV